jgi:hypothetical protein
MTIKATLANQTKNAIQLFQGGLFGEIGSKSGGRISSFIGGEEKFSI